ncbi:two-component system sensor histidine kinase NtrB [Qipengyuania spongiae]|uniref:histidine kinase n=1 Tax=Qipengyuania spongiae TaxID=2909673 RepID=A0ABY5SX42_9SPHN|nr:ATP-binding protein [Qipengyuania spongiae]UVI38890.1 ATP-binding protein [Qipengyuania spongiae]
MTACAEPPGAAIQISALIFAVLLIDENLSVREANPAAETMFGISAARLSGRPLFELCHSDDARILESLRQAEGQFIARGADLRCAGRDLFVNLTASPLTSHPGWRVITLSEIGSGQGVGESTIAGHGAPSILAHEIKNPLSAIRGASQLLARRSEPRNVPLAHLIEAEVDRIAGLVDRMQQLGQQSVEPLGPVNLHEAVRSAMATMRAGRPEGPELKEEFDPSLPLVLAHRAVLEQVLINLLANACDAASAVVDPMVQVRTRFVSDLVIKTVTSGRSIRLPIEITVTDNGSGVPAELRDHVFRPFTTSKPGGQGLGLALARKLVTDMGGRVAYHRDDAAGLTHFRINLAAAGAAAK